MLELNLVIKIMAVGSQQFLKIEDRAILIYRQALVQTISFEY